ncbi:MAG: LysR substrate-binding domain-containing protein [Betaproteobacteria bacterium]
MPDLNDLYFYAQVVEHAGFAPAARALGVPKSKLSRRVAMLEQRLGVRLIQRSTRRFSVTEIGQEYYRRCVAMLVEAEAAQEVIDRVQSEPRGTVNLSCPIALLHARVAPMLIRFMTQCPQVKLHLEATNRRVDVIREGFDIALRVRFPPVDDSDLVMRTFGASGQLIVASPELFERGPRPAVPGDLPLLPSLDLGPPNREHAWHLEGPDGGLATVLHQPRFVTDDMAALRVAALSGIGVVQLPEMLVLDDIAAGRLERMLPHWRAPAGLVQAIFPSRRGLIPAVRRLVDFLASEFASPAAPAA